MKAVITRPEGNYKLGEVVEVDATQFAKLVESGLAVSASEWAAQQAVVKARESVIDSAIEAGRKEGKFLPKEDVSAIRATALTIEAASPGAGVSYVNVQPVKAAQNLEARITSSTEKPEAPVGLVEVGELGLKDAIKAFYHADAPFQKEQKNGGIVRAARFDPHTMKEAVDLSRKRSVITAHIAKMVAGGADFSKEDVVRATATTAATVESHSSTLGTLNTGLLLQWNLGFLKNQLAPINDISTDISDQPVLFNQTTRTRYITVPGVMSKSDGASWTTSGSGVAANTVDVDVKMDQHIGVPIAFGNNTLGSTPRQLFNEQRTPQLYGLGEYLLYKLIYTAFNGSNRIINAGTTYSTVTFNPGYTNAQAGHTFSLANATLATFTADLPAAMDASKFPGGDEMESDEQLQRFAWVHTNVYSSAVADTNFVLNQSIQRLGADKGENVLRTGRFSRLGNIKFRKSQLVTDQCAVTGTGVYNDPYYVTAGTYANATNIGICGTRNSLLFVSRVPLDYTKVLPDVPSTAAIELVTEPDTGLTFMVVKYLDHAYETANMRVQLMFGTAIGDERQGMLLTK